MKLKLVVISLVATFGLCTQAFSFELLDRMLGGYGPKSTCCDGGSYQKGDIAQKGHGSAQKGRCHGCGLFGSKCGCGSSVQKGYDAPKGHSSAQKGRCGGCGLFGSRCGCGSAGKGSHKSGSSVQKGNCRQPLFGGCGGKGGCHGKGGDVAQKGSCGSKGHGHGGLFDRLFGCHSCGSKSGKGMMGAAQTPGQVPSQVPGDKGDKYLPPAPVVDPASYAPYNAAASTR